MMNSCIKILLFAIKRKKPILSIPICYKHTMGDPVEHATGIEKRELLAKLAGNENPFDMKTLKRGPGTKTQPNEIPSAFDQRLVGCICEEDTCHINWMWLMKGQPRRCECGYWFKLVRSAPL